MNISARDNFEISTVQDLLYYSKKILCDSNIDTYSLDADLIVTFACNLKTRESLFLELEKTVDDNVINKCNELLNRRTEGEPIAHILNKVDFWDLTLFVNKDVLIPRPDSETLVEVLLKIINENSINKNKLKILDLGTGSGCLIITVLKILTDANGVAVDIDDNALKVASINAQNLNVADRIHFIKSNWFSSLSQNENYDVIICNPPYITLKEWRELNKSVKDYEPQIALTDYLDGLSHYKIIAQNLSNFLNKNGFALFEIGYNQKDLALKIFQEKNFNVKFHKDLSGIARVAEVTRVF